MKIMLLIITLKAILIALFTYLVIVGGNMSETEEEQRMEDEEQIKYLQNYKNGGKKGGKRYL